MVVFLHKIHNLCRTFYCSLSFCNNGTLTTNVSRVSIKVREKLEKKVRIFRCIFIVRKSNRNDKIMQKNISTLTSQGHHQCHLENTLIYAIAHYS